MKKNPNIMTYLQDYNIWYCQKCQSYDDEQVDELIQLVNDLDEPQIVRDYRYKSIRNRGNIEPLSDTNLRYNDEYPYAYEIHELEKYESKDYWREHIASRLTRGKRARTGSKSGSGDGCYLGFNDYDKAIMHGKNCWNSNGLEEGVSPEEFFSTKLPEIALKYEKKLDYDKAIELYDYLGDRIECSYNNVIKFKAQVERRGIALNKEADSYLSKAPAFKTKMDKFYDDVRRVRKLKANMAAPKTEIHGDYVDDRDTIVKDSVINRSNVGAGEDDKLAKIKELKELLDSGAIDKDDYEKMKREIIG